MARISNYRTDTVLHDKDRLVVSSYEGEGQAGPIYVTNNISLSRLADFLNLNFSVDDVNFNLNSLSTTVTGHTTSIASINNSISTNTSNISSNATYSINLASSFGTFDSNGNLTSLSEAFANSVMNTTTAQDAASATALTNLTAIVNNNTSSITSNASNITTVTASATTNAGNISTNTGSINTVTTTANANAASIVTLNNNLATTNSNVTQSASDITSLTATVTSNTTNIASNDTDITSVTNSAAANASNITTLTNNLATTNSNVTQSATDITNLTATVNTNTTNITNNDSDITSVTNTAATNASNITTLTNNLATANTSINQNASNVTSLTGTVNTNTTTIAGKPETFKQTSAPAVSKPVGSLWFDTDDNNKVYILVSGSPNVWTAVPDSRIAANANSITTNSSNITANASDITTLTNSIATTNANVTQNATNVTNLTSTVTSNTAAITSNDGDITTANTNIASNASDITTLTNNLATANTAISQNASNNTSLTSTVSTNTTNIALKPDVFRQNNAPAVTVATGSLWYDTNDGNKPYVLVAGNPKVWTQTTDGAIAAGDAVNASAITTANTNIATNASNITTLTNDLTTAETDITQNATNTTNLTSTVSTNTTNIGNKPNVYRQDDAPAVSVPVGSLWYDTNDSNKIYVLVSGSPNVWTLTDDSRVATNASNIGTNTTNITSNATSITTLTNDLDTAETNITQNATNHTSLTSTVTTNTTNITGNSTNIASKPNVFRQDAEPAVTEPVGSLWYDTNDNNKLYVLISGSPNAWTVTKDGDIAANSTNITTNASNITTLTSNLATANTNITNNASNITTLTSSVTTNATDITNAETDITTNATNISTLNTGLTTANTNISANSSNITTLDTASTNHGTNITANATNITNLSTTVGNNTTSITTNATSINGINGKYGVTINANGALTGFALNGGGGTSSFIINANDFKIFNSGGNLNPFSVSGNRVQINGDLNVSSAATIGGTATSLDSNGRATALLLKNLGAVSGDSGSVCMEMQSASRYHHVIEMTGGGGTSGNFDLSAKYRLGKSVTAAAEGDNYSKQVMILNGAGLIIPNQTANSVTASANYASGMNIIFNDNSGSRTVNSGRLHVSEYYKTFFLDVPNASGGTGTYQNDIFNIRKLITGSPDFEYSLFSIDVNNNAYFRGTIFDMNSTSHYLDMDNTGDSLKVKGDVVAFVSSDKRFKENIVNISNPLDKLNKINGVSFTWNKISHKETGKKDIGVIAQEIEQVFPEIVETRDNGYKAVDYPKLTALLIESIKELNNKIKKLEYELTK